MINLAIEQPKSPRGRSTKKRLIIVVVFLVLIGGVSAAAYFFLVPEPVNFTGDKVKLIIAAPQEVVSGSQYEYTIEYKNREGVALTDANLIIYLPPGFNFVDSLPEPEERPAPLDANIMKNLLGDFSSRTWNVGRLEAGGDGKVVIKGIILGELDTTQVLKATLFYQPESFSSNFSAEEQVEMLIKKSLIELDLEMPEKTGRNREMELSLKYKNATSEDLENIQIVFNYPEGFNIVSSEPRADKDNRIWDLSLLRSGDRGRIDIRGKLDTEKPIEFFSAELGIIDQFKQFFTQVKADQSLAVLNPKLEITLTVNGEEQINLNPGDELNFVITYSNIGDVSIENGMITFALPSDLVDAGSIEVENGIFDYDAHEFIWNHTSDSNLEKIPPEGKGKVEFKANLMSNFPFVSLDRRNLKLEGMPKFSSNKIEGLEGFEYEVEGNNLEAKINTELSLVQEARYYTLEYEQAGSGPLPPKVGQKTTFRIYWTLTNTTNDAEDIKVETILPVGVEWMKNFYVSVGESVSFDPDSRKVTWNVGRLQAYAGTLLPGAQAWFEVGVTPTLDQVGQVLPLTLATFVTGRDLFTETEIKSEYPATDTNLENDLGALGKGEVVK